LRKKTLEDYIELVYDLEEGKLRVHTNDIASKFNINPASVTEIFQKLSKEGYIDYEKYSGVKLTNKGKKLAINIKKRHDVLTEFLVILGVDKKIAEKDACDMEHILHPNTMNTIIKFVEVIKNCEFTPYWLNRLKTYVKTGKLSKCPPEIAEICLKYTKK
jgi:DtxR family Mn-dependent transcriptional regulator